jgi:hypothetical protein
MSLVHEPFFSVPCGDSTDGVFSDGFPDDKIKNVITANNVVGGRDMSHEVLAVSLGDVTKGFKAVPFLEDWPFNAVVKVPGFGNLPVFFAFTNSSGWGTFPLRCNLQIRLSLAYSSSF